MDTIFEWNPTHKAVEMTPIERWRAILLLSILVLTIGCTDAATEPLDPVRNLKGEKAFKTVYAVLTHPRCMNCHPSGDRPLQHDDSRPHAMNVQRGKDGAGRPGMRCVTCHGKANRSQAHLPPGSKEWRLALKSQSFQNHSPQSLAKQLKNPKLTHLDLKGVVKHVEDDALVGWGWNPGPGRKAVPISRKDFVQAFKTWVAAGAPIPKEEPK